MNSLLLLSVLVVGCSAFKIKQDAPFAFNDTANIIGGRKAKLNEFPYQVGFRKKGQSSTFCGGSIISDEWMISAGHCFDGRTGKIEDIEAVIGSLDVKNPGKVVGKLTAKVHPDFGDQNRHPDITLIRVSGGGLVTKGGDWITAAVKLNDDPKRKLAGSTATVSGYGAINEVTQEQSRYIKTTNVEIQKDEVCSDLYKKGDFDPETSDLCVGDMSGDSGACFGDSGGPLVIGEGSERIQVGVVSRGYSCARRNTPKIYAHVAHLMAWIKEVTGLKV